MKKVFMLATCLATATLATDFSQINTDELIKMRGTVSVEERSAFREEMQKRMQSMTPEQRQQFMQSSPGKRQNMGKGMGMGKGMSPRSGQGMGMGKGMNAPRNKGMQNRPTFTTYDLNNDGKITQKEFDTAHAQRMQQKADEGKMLKNAGKAPTFQSIDKDNDGTVTPAEFQTHQMNQNNRMQAQGVAK